MPRGDPAIARRNVSPLSFIFAWIPFIFAAFSSSKVANDSLEGSTFYKTNRYNLSIENHYKEGYYNIQIHANDPSGNTIQGNVKSLVHGDPIVNSREVDLHRVVYTHQNSIHHAQGSITVNDKKYTFVPDQDYSGMDFTIGLHSYKTTWNWACAAGISDKGIPCAINFAMDIDKDDKTSNSVICYWIGNDFYRVSEVLFEYFSTDGIWKIYSAGKEIDLTFQPLGKRKGKLSTGILGYDFTQPFGIFKGTLQDKNHEDVLIADMRGVTEEHLAWW